MEADLQNLAEVATILKSDIGSTIVPDKSFFHQNQNRPFKTNTTYIYIHNSHTATNFDTIYVPFGGYLSISLRLQEQLPDFENPRHPYFWTSKTVYSPCNIQIDQCWQSDITPKFEPQPGTSDHGQVGTIILSEAWAVKSGVYIGPSRCHRPFRSGITCVKC